MDAIDSPPEPMDEDVDDAGGDVIYEPCLVCNMPAKGLHFQVNACRACAAFFRRSIKSIIVYRCQRGSGTCDVTLKTPGKPLCRYCRLKKCVKIGMKIDNSKEDGAACGTTTELVYDRKNLNMEIASKYEGLDKIVEAIYKRDISIHPESGFKMTLRFSTHLEKFLDHFRPKGPVTNITEFAKLKTVQDSEYFRNYLIHIAELTLNFDYFGQLAPKEKFSLYKHFWQVFHHIERMYMTGEYFGDDINDGRMLINDRHSVDVNGFKMLWTGKTSTQQESIDKLMSPLKDKIQRLATPMKRLRMTLFELAYVSEMILWSCFEINDLSQTTHKLADEIMFKASNELHEYYIRELRIANYASRQASLLKMINVSEFIVRDKKNIQTIDKIFNIFDVPFIDTGLT